MSELELEMQELFEKRLRNFCAAWELNGARSEVMARAMDVVSEELRDE